MGSQLAMFDLPQPASVIRRRTRPGLCPPARDYAQERWMAEQSRKSNASWRAEQAPAASAGHNGGPPLDDPAPRPDPATAIRAEIARLEECARWDGLKNQPHKWSGGASRAGPFSQAAMRDALAKRQPQIDRLMRKLARMEAR